MMNENEYWGICWNNPNIEIEHDRMEAEFEEYDDLRLAQRLKKQNL